MATPIEKATRPGTAVAKATGLEVIWGGVCILFGVVMFGAVSFRLFTGNAMRMPWYQFTGGYVLALAAVRIGYLRIRGVVGRHARRLPTPEDD